jgi:thioredoxin 2
MHDTLLIVCPQCSGANRVPTARLHEGPVCGHCKSPLFTGHPVETDEDTFSAQINRSGIPVVVDFWAPWCAPCRAMAPAFQQAASALEPNFRFAKVNTEEVPTLAARFGIRSIPTVAVFRGGREVSRQSGALDRTTLIQWLRQFA